MSTNNETKFQVKGMYKDHGSYFLRWRVHGKRRTQKLGRVNETTKEDAEALALDFKNGKRGVFVNGSNSGNLTFLAVFDDLLSTIGKTRWKESTKAKHKELVYGMLQEFHNQKITEIDKWAVRNWYYSDRNTKRQTRTEVAYRTLHRIFEHAKNQLDFIDVNPCQIPKGDRYRNKIRKIKINHENSDLGKFLFQLAFGKPKQIKRSYETSRDLVLLFLLTAVRRTALGSLKWENVDFPNRLIKISPEHNKKHKGDDTFQEIPMARIVQRMLKCRFENREKLCETLKGESPLIYVFPDRFGKTHVQDVRVTIKRICEAANIAIVGPHDLRRTVASFLSEVSDDYVLRQQYLDHSFSDVHVKHYAGNQSLIRRRKFAQDVADLLSRSLSGEGADGMLSGRIDLAADNRTEIDERWSDENTLEWVLYGDAEEKEVAIEKFVWAVEGNAITEMMENSRGVEEFQVVKGGYVSASESRQLLQED